MLKLSKRCKSLVVLLLLCGFCLSFSSVSFADSAQVTSPPPAFYNVSLSNDLDSLLNMEIAFYNGTSTLDFHDPDYLRIATVNTTSMLSVIINNRSDRDVLLDLRSIQLENMQFSWDTGNSTIINSSGIIGLNSYSGFLRPRSFAYGNLVCGIDESYLYESQLYVPAQTTINSNILVEFASNVMNTTGDIPSNILSTYGSPRISSFSVAGFIADGVDVTVVAPGTYVPPYLADKQISDDIQNQTQQQQQQYEDLTDPGTTEGEEFISGTDNAIKDKIGIFTFIDTLLENLLGLFVPPDGDPTLTLPGFSIEIAGERHQIWTDQTFNLASLDEDFSVLLTAVRFGTVAVVYFALINFLGDTYLRIFAGGKEDD